MDLSTCPKCAAPVTRIQDRWDPRAVLLRCNCPKPARAYLGDESKPHARVLSGDDGGTLVPRRPDRRDVGVDPAAPGGDRTVLVQRGWEQSEFKVVEPALNAFGVAREIADRVHDELAKLYLGTAGKHWAAPTAPAAAKPYPYRLEPQTKPRPERVRGYSRPEIGSLWESRGGQTYCVEQVQPRDGYDVVAIVELGGNTRYVDLWGELVSRFCLTDKGRLAPAVPAVGSLWLDRFDATFAVTDWNPRAGANGRATIDQQDGDPSSRMTYNGDWNSLVHDLELRAKPTEPTEAELFEREMVGEFPPERPRSLDSAPPDDSISDRPKNGELCMGQLPLGSKWVDGCGDAWVVRSKQSGLKWDGSDFMVSFAAVADGGKRRAKVSLKQLRSMHNAGVLRRVDS